MKTISFFLLSVPLLSFGAPPEKIQFNCSVPTTVFSVRTEDRQVLTTVNSPYGIEFTPLHRGAFSAASIRQINAQTEVIKKLGKELTFRWPLEECKSDDNDVYECSHGGPFEANGWKIHPITFRTIQNHLKLSQGKYDVYTVEISFTVENAPEEAGLLFSLSSDYNFKSHCQFSP